MSPARVFTAAALAGIVGVWAGVALIGSMSDQPPLPDPWFAPYVDATLTPLFPFELEAASPAAEILLAFVVADQQAPCTPTWGTFFGLDEAAVAIDLDRRIARVRQRGDDVMVSFGGAHNDELAVTCEDDAVLAAAYRAVIDRYRISTIDFDIEGAGLGDTDAGKRRARAVKAVQDDVASSGGSLEVWLTLPVTPAGLSSEAVAVVDKTLAAGVDLTGVNVMAMNYGDSRHGDDMAAATIKALEATHRQLGEAYRRAGINLGSERLWRKIGATPMIGRNDTITDVWDLDASRSLMAFVAEKGIGRVSMWSLNRDAPCGPNIDTRYVSDHCTGLDDPTLAFTAVFNTLPRHTAATPTSTTTLAAVLAASLPRDDPATSPYPIWREDRGYKEGCKVVWHRNVYQAKWWNQDEVPDAPVLDEWETPWRLIGPVLAEDRPPPPPATLAPGTYPEWSAATTYERGSKVIRDGLGYEAKWWTRGDLPGADVPNDWDTPWKPLFDVPC